MGLKCNISFRKASVVVSFFLIVLSQRIFASGLSIQSKPKDCGSDHISYLSGSGHDFFYINGRLVDKYLFCNALKYYHANHCFITDDDLNHLCGLGLSLDELPLNPGRKFLHKLVREESARRNFLENSQPTEERDSQKSLLAPKMAVGALGMIMLCCSFLCPCFRARRKQADHTVLTKDLQSSESKCPIVLENIHVEILNLPLFLDSVSSLEMNPAPEKIPGSPLRVPGSPLRVPGSPLRVPPSPARFSMSPKIDRMGSVHLNINQVARATQNFSPSMMLGEGGYGTVYKAQLQDGQIVAIKRAKKIGTVQISRQRKASYRRRDNLRDMQTPNTSLQTKKASIRVFELGVHSFAGLLAVHRISLEWHMQGIAPLEHFEALRTEFSSEVQLLSKIDHRNLVKLLGYLDKGNERLIITEYVPNGTLREHLDGMRGKILDFNQRLEISIDVAHALTYLHLYSEKQIIHRDVKSSNILLTESMRAKVADFGFARLGSVDSDKTHISTKVKGTVGYLDPEYMRTYQLTPKSDVYSFGVVLLEILTGRRPVELKKPADERVTLRWAFKKYDEGNVREIVDPLMQEVVDEDILMKMFELAFQCAAPTRSDRPDMKAVGEQLWAVRMDYLRSGRRG
ncbi:hypothetical protein RHSIM_Rhsim01G0060300 [Rhododendron simsii]|uniref:non-specific serine/threonine protein kinase n=1 Tax=Rhododendron simsii TaxID=118357 RepID=A0A834HUJ2_RHOSS|nr:hypothetical protein RHSIM_Rhsim01G0060300 [Rhododendron simsii]